MARVTKTLAQRDLDRRQVEAFDRDEVGPDPETPGRLNEKQAKMLVAAYEQESALLASAKGIGIKIDGIYSELVAAGFDKTTVKAAFKRRRGNQDEIAEAEALLRLYFEALPAPDEVYQPPADEGEGDDGGSE